MIKLPKHECGLSIEHNENRNYYETVATYLSNYAEDLFNFESNEDRQKCIDTNELWLIRWYPDSPIGSCNVAASTLEKALALANKED